MRWDEHYANPPEDNQMKLAVGADGQEGFDEAREWVDSHPYEFEFMVNNAERLFIKNGWVSANYLVNMVRNEHNVKVKNGHAPFIARIISAKRPDLKDAFKTHSSKADGWC